MPNLPQLDIGSETSRLSRIVQQFELFVQKVERKSQIIAELKKKNGQAGDTNSSLNQDDDGGAEPIENKTFYSNSRF